MNSAEKAVELAKLKDEGKEIEYLSAIYQQAFHEVKDKLTLQSGKINALLADWNNLSDVEKSVLQATTYQKNFQEEIKKQITEMWVDLFSGNYNSIKEYIQNGYETGFVGTMYTLHKSGIPLVFPIDHKKVIAASQYNPKLSKNLYTKLGEDWDMMKAKVAQTVARGVATSSSWGDIAKNIEQDTVIGRNRAIRIARTEGHRVQCEAAFEAQTMAAANGADIVKQWDAALDARTRQSHRQVDGEIRKLNEPFSNGLLYPADENAPAAEVINCRCALLQRARWALDDDELDTLKKRAAYFGLDKTQNFEDFKQKYLNAASVVQNIPPAKKQYLTEKKLTQNIADADDEIAKLKAQQATATQAVFDSLQQQIDALEIQKIDWQGKLDKKLKDKQIKALKAEKADLNDKWLNYNVKTYSGIWQDDVSEFDWYDKQGSIAAKKQYFQKKLSYVTGADKVKFQDLLDSLEEFDKNGSEYFGWLVRMQEIDDEIKDIKKFGIRKSGTGIFAPEAYGKRKQEAWANRFRDRYTADKYYRPLLDKDWDNLTDNEKFGIWQYTHNSHPINKPLSGYRYYWDRGYFEGFGNVSWDIESMSQKDNVLEKVFEKFKNAVNPYGKNVRKYKETIADLTTAIEKTSLDADKWFIRGSDEGGLAGLVDSVHISYREAEQMVLNKDIAGLKSRLVGNTFQNHSFTSTAIADEEGIGFGGRVSYKIYAPKGTKAIYAEPSSYWGDTINRTQRIYKVGDSYYTISTEAEMTFQRGTKFRFTDVKLDSKGRVEVTMEVVEQPSYFKTGFEHTFDDGLTSE